MLMTKEYILECLDKYCDFDGVLHRENFEEMVVRPLKANECFENWTWDNGVSKGVLIFSGLNFVVKIPFTGWAEWQDSHYEDENGNWRCWESAHKNTDELKSRHYKMEGYEDYCEFSGADFDEESDGWDYCMVEQIRYEKAVDAGLETMFARTHFIGRVGGNEHPIYIQERCNMFDEAYCTSNKEKYNKRTSKDYEKVDTLRKEFDFHMINDDWILDFIIFFGEELLKKFVDFCFDMNIYDLHDGNIGYHDGIPCLVDYSSYED